MIIGPFLRRPLWVRNITCEREKLCARSPWALVFALFGVLLGHRRPIQAGELKRVRQGNYIPKGWVGSGTKGRAGPQARHSGEAGPQLSQRDEGSSGSQNLERTAAGGEAPARPCGPSLPSSNLLPVAPLAEPS